MDNRDKKDYLMEEIMGMRKRRIIPENYCIPFINKYPEYQREDEQEAKSVVTRIRNVWNNRTTDEKMTGQFKDWEVELMAQRNLQRIEG